MSVTVPSEAGSDVVAGGGARAQVRELLEMIKFQHALFALPFAFVGMLAGARGLPTLGTLGWIVACMVGARTAAMTWNRIADRDVDAANPRTAGRALPAGRVGLGAAWLLLVASVALFVLGAAMLNALALALAPVALAVVIGYSLTKRFTWASHFVLGAALSLAPLGAWVAVTGRVEWVSVVLGVAVAAWVAGFDILYSCQDAEFDRANGLHSVPARFGVARALHAARALHVVAAMALFAFGQLRGLESAWFVGTGLAAAVMLWSHSLVSARDLSRVGVAFFQANVAVSLLVLGGTAVAVLGGTAVAALGG